LAHPEPGFDVKFRHSKSGYGQAILCSTNGPFRLLPTQLLLLEGEKPVPLGSRALEILTVLLERRGELVSKQDLMARAWPNVFIEPANLTVHMSALRRALRDGRDGHRFIVNIPGRGYCFVASVAMSAHEN
jgi:DNA-binding winged helix-turn-helix (wHTH) protein